MIKRFDACFCTRKTPDVLMYDETLKEVYFLVKLFLRYKRQLSHDLYENKVCRIYIKEYAEIE